MNQYFNEKLSLFLTEVRFYTSEENRCHIFKMDIFSKLFEDVMSHIISWNADKKVNTISELFINKFLILLVCHLNALRLYMVALLIFT